MSLYYRLKRLLGYDTTNELTHTHPVYEYTIKHMDGDTNTVICHGYNTDGAFARFYTYTEPHLSRIHGYSVWCGGVAINRVLEGIKEIQQERVGESEFRMVVDYADGEVLESEVVSDAT